MPGLLDEEYPDLLPGYGLLSDPSAPVPPGLLDTRRVVPRHDQVDALPVPTNNEAADQSHELADDRLEFDGSRMRLIIGGNIERDWPAVSGVPGFQTKEFQDKEGRGPIPEGRYRAGQDQFQSISSLSAWERLKSGWGGGKWRGLEDAWGDHRVWLEPMEGTNTFGRRDMAIHGGKYPGSKGCIDLTYWGNDFANAFRDYGKDLPLYVRYR